MRKRVEKTAKDKQDNVTQLKSLFALFTQQRKALEISIQKTKKYEEENLKLDARSKTLEEQSKGHNRRVELLEQERDMLVQKHRKDREHLESELDDKKQVVKKYESEFKEISGQKFIMKK